MRVLIWSVLVTLVSGFVMYTILAQLPWSEIPWLGDWFEGDSTDEAGGFLLFLSWGAWVLIGLIQMLLFPYVALIVATFFQDQIITQTEQYYYPNLPTPLSWRLWDTIRAQAQLLLKVLLVNVLFIPLYLILLFTGIGLVLLMAVVNGYILGVEFYMMVGQRRLVEKQQRQSLAKHRVQVHLYGILVYLMLLIPLWNLIMPLFACMVFTHFFYRHHAQNYFMTRPEV